MNISVKVEIPRELPVRELDNYIDLTVHNIARLTLDYVNTKGGGENHTFFPRDSGDLQAASMGAGVTKYGKNSYYLGADGTVDYAEIVWNYPKGTNWTNPSTYPQWYLTEYKNEKELITSIAVQNAKNGVRM